MRLPVCKNASVKMSRTCHQDRLTKPRRPSTARYHLNRSANQKYFGLSTNSTAIKQRRHRAYDKAGLKYFEGLGYIEPGLVQHILYATVDPDKLNKMPVTAGLHSKATLQRVLTDHLRYAWAETWREEWLACGGESAPQVPCADPRTHRRYSRFTAGVCPLWFWF